MEKYKAERKYKLKVGNRVESCQGKDFPKITNVTLDGVCVKDIPTEVNVDIPIFETIDEEIRYHKKELARLKAQKQKEKWKFTEDEKVILRNLPKHMKWIARDDDAGGLKVFCDKPIKKEKRWICEKYIVGTYGIYIFGHLFQCIQWEDDEPCEFRKFI